MKTLIPLYTICILILTGCQDDSDYIIGNYDVITTVKLSSCPEEIFEFPDKVFLPTNLLPGQTSIYYWKLRRIGITGSGADKITVDINAPNHPDYTLQLSGVLDDGLVRIEMQQNVIEEHCEVYRFVLLYGIIENNTLVGEIRTILSHIRGSDRCPMSIPPFSPCEVYEMFVGTIR
jgi:hypothetical protein